MEKPNTVFRDLIFRLSGKPFHIKANRKMPRLQAGLGMFAISPYFKYNKYYRSCKYFL